MTEHEPNEYKFLDWRQADDRGRVNLGTDFAEEEVKVAVLETNDDCSPGGRNV